MTSTNGLSSTASEGRTVTVWQVRYRDLCPLKPHHEDFNDVDSALARLVELRVNGFTNIRLLKYTMTIMTIDWADDDGRDNEQGAAADA